MSGGARTEDPSPRFWRAAWGLGALGLVVRLVLGRFEPPPPTRYLGGPLLADETWYVRVARAVLHGRGFTLDGAPTALHGPLTVLLLVPATWLQPSGYDAQRATMALLGALGVVAIAAVGRELAGDRVGWIAGLIAAAYPGLWVNDLVATSESPAIVLLAATLLLSLRCRRLGPAPRRVALLGLAVGLLALDRAELGVLGLALAVPGVVAGAQRSTRDRWRLGVAAAILVGSIAVLVVPWTAYNEVRFHQVVLVSDDLGQTLVGANCPQSYYGALTGYDGTTCYFPVLARELHEHPHANEAQRDGHFRDEAVAYAAGHVGRWPVVGLLREGWLWSLWRPGWTAVTAAAYIGRPAWLTWLQVASFWALAPFALVGAVVARRRGVLRWPMVTMVGFTALVGLLVVGNLRYRIAAEVAVVLLAALALDELVGPRGRRAQSAVARVGSGAA